MDLCASKCFVEMETIEVGSQGHIFRCRDNSEDVAFVLKIIRDGTMGRETTAIKMLESCPYIVRLHDVEIPEKLKATSIAMRYYQHGELFSFMAVRIMTDPLAKSLFRQCLCSIQGAHLLGIVHRDIKPENIFVDDDFSLVLGDWGFSEIFVSGDCMIDDSKMVKGTLDYAAPEVLELVQDDIYDGRKADVWSLGCILFQMLSGLSPFGERGPTIDDWFYKQIRRKAFGKFWNAHERYMSTQFSPEAKRFLERIFVANPRDRCTVDELLLDPWLLDEILTPEVYLASMRALYEEILTQKSDAEPC